MAQTESRFVTRRMAWQDGNFTEMNHLGAALIAKPEVFSGKMQRIFSSYLYSDNSLSALLSETGREQTIDKSEWEWMLRGASTRPLVYYGTAATGTVGTYGALFDLPLDEKFYKAGDILTPGNPLYQVRVQRDPVPAGLGYLYKVTYMTTDETAAFPLRFLQPGVKWAKLYSQYEEGSEQSGSLQLALPMYLKNRMSRLRKQYMVTGDASMEVLSVQIQDSTGKMQNSWMRYTEAEFWMQYYKEQERSIWYSRDTDSIQGSTGRPLRTGAGIEQQLEESHRHGYSVLTANLIEEFVTDIFYSRVAPGGARKLKAFTGEWGMIQFSRAIASKYQNNGFVTVDSNFIQSASSPYHTNALSYGYQFTRYKMSNGAELELIHNPLYDDRTIHFDIDPITGYPYESMKYTFMDLSGEGAASNVRLLKKKNAMSLVYVCGLASPYGPQKNTIGAAHAGDYYEMHVKDFAGAHIEDVSRCGQLFLSERS